MKSLGKSIAVLVLLAAGARMATASNVTVDCSGGVLPPGVFPTIQAALATLDNEGPHTVTVTGTCVESPAVVIIFRRNLTIEAPEGQTATVTNVPSPSPKPVVIVIGAQNLLLRRLLITGGRGIDTKANANVNLEGVTIENSAGNGLSVSTNSTVTMGNKSAAGGNTIQNNAGNGISVDASVLIFQGFNTIQNNTFTGLLASASRVALQALGPNTIRGNGNGIVASSATAVDVTGQHFVQNNSVTGVVAVDGGVVHFNSVTLPDTSVVGVTISNNTRSGAGAIFGAQMVFNGSGHVVSNNGDGTNPFRAGIFASHNSALRIAGISVTSNLGPGIQLDTSSTLRLVGTTVSGNSEEGVRVTVGSIAEFGDPTGVAPPNTISGNGGPNASCDTTSFATGDTSNIAKFKCNVPK